MKRNDIDLYHWSFVNIKLFLTKMNVLFRRTSTRYTNADMPIYWYPVAGDCYFPKCKTAALEMPCEKKSINKIFNLQKST